MSTARVAVEYKVQLTEHVEQRRQIQPGRLLLLTVVVPKVTTDFPEFLVPDKDHLARLTAERVTAADGFFLGISHTPGSVSAKPRGSGSIMATAPGGSKFFAGGLVGPAPGGRRLSPGEAIAELEAAIAAGRFTVDEVAVFAQEHSVDATLRKGALEHVGDWLAQLRDHHQATAFAAIAKAGLVPGFDGSGGREALLDFLNVAVKRATIPELFDLIGALKAAGGAV